MNNLVEINRHGMYEWDLSHDVHGFFDRFLDGLAEAREIIPRRIGLYEWNEWMHEAGIHPNNFRI